MELAPLLLFDKKFLSLNPKYPVGPLRRRQVNKNFRAVRPHHRADICITRKKNNHQFFTYMVHNIKQGNSVARDLPPTGSEANTTIFVLYILDIDSHCPYLLSGETTFQLTSCSNSLHVYLRFGEITCHNQ